MKRRKEKRMSVGDLSNATSIDAKSLVLIEHGQAIMNIEHLLRICTYLDMTPNQILAGEFVSSGHAGLGDIMQMLNVEGAEQIIEEEDEQDATPVGKDNETVLMEIKNMLEEYRKEQQASKAASHRS